MRVVFHPAALAGATSDITRGGGMMTVVGVLLFLAPHVFLVQLALWLDALAHTGYIGWCILRPPEVGTRERCDLRVRACHAVEK